MSVEDCFKTGIRTAIDKLNTVLEDFNGVEDVK